MLLPRPLWLHAYEVALVALVAKHVKLPEDLPCLKVLWGCVLPRAGTGWPGAHKATSWQLALCQMCSSSP